MLTKTLSNKEIAKQMRVCLISVPAAIALLIGCSGGGDASDAASQADAPAPKKVEATPFPGGAPSQDQKDASEPAKAKTDEQLVVFKMDNKVVCPVMGSDIKSPEDAKYQDYNGVRYYFCCDDCPPQFKADPAKYADGKYLKSKAKTDEPGR